MTVDPHDPNIVLVAAQGDVHVKSHDRGVFRSTDGGATWTQTLFVDDSTGAQKLARAFDTPNVVFATTVRALHAADAAGAARWRRARGAANAPAGPTSTKLSSRSMAASPGRRSPAAGCRAPHGRTWVAVANNTRRAARVRHRRLRVSSAPTTAARPGGRWPPTISEFETARAATTAASTSIRRIPTSSTRSTPRATSRPTAARRSPASRARRAATIRSRCGSIPPTASASCFGYDQGAIVSLDGGGTWSSWYNQSTEQIYHLSVDNSFPYWVYGTQQDAGAIRTRIRGNLGAITPLDWNPVSGWEWGTIVPDPLDPNTVYASGSGILKISYPSEQWINVSPAADPSLQLRTTIVAADRVRAVESAHAHRRLPVGLVDRRRRRALDDDQPRPRRAPRRADASRRAPAHDGAARRRDRVDRRLHGRAGHDLGRHEQRADQSHARTAARPGTTRRSRAFPTRSAAKSSRVEPSHFDAADRVRRPSTCTASATTRRTSTARATTARRGRASSTACATNQPSGSFARVVRERPEEARAAVRRHGERHVRLVRRRRPLAIAAC